MTRIDFAPLYRSTVGFDRMTPFLETALKTDEAANHFPPYNIVKSGDDAYRISLAVPGFEESDLDIELNQGVLTVAGGKPDTGDEPQYLYRGISALGFKRQFQLADYVEVVGASLAHGLLHIDLERRIPEAMKPRAIKISAGPVKKGAVIEGKSKPA